MGQKLKKIFRLLVSVVASVISKIGQSIFTVLRRIAGVFGRKTQQARIKVDQKYHARFLQKWAWYARWHTWKWKQFTHKHVHAFAAAGYVFLVVIFALHIIGPASALSTWTQTDWSGGVGASTTNQYVSASNLVTSTAGSFSLARDEKQTNGGFESNLNSWTTTYDPSSIGSNLKAWYKADAITGTSDGTAVSSWADSSGNSYTATQATGANQPLYKTNIINGKPVLRFDGTNDSLATLYTPPTGLGQRTVFTVTTNHSTSGVWRYVYSYGTGTNGGSYSLVNVMGVSGASAVFGNAYWNSELTSTLNSQGSTSIISQAYDGTTDYLYGNGTQVGTKVQALATGSGVLRLGTSVIQNGNAGFDMAEMLVFDTNLSASQRQSIEAYLSLKYNISVSGGYSTATRDTTTTHSGSTGSAKITNPATHANFTQSINVGDTSTYGLEAYAYTNGGTITSADAQLYYNGSAVSTTYTAAGGGWYKLTGSVTGANAARDYGVQVKSGKTVYIDDFSVYKYQSTGTLTSNIFDLSFGGDWGTLLYTATGSGTTAVKVRTSNSATMSGAPAFSGCSAITSSTDLTGQSCVTDNQRYVQYEVTLSPSGFSTPSFEDISVNYTPWDTTAPTTNASNIVMKKISGGSTISSNAWTNGTQPYFEWTAGADNVGGEGMKGYCLYLGTDNTADPVTTKGILGTSPLNTSGACQFAVSGTSIDLGTPNYLGSALATSNTAYYLRIKAIDNVNNVYSGTPTDFHFRFDNTEPTNPTYISAPSQFLSTKEATMTWPTNGGDTGADGNSGYAGLQYKIGNSTWYGDVHNGAQDTTDLLTNDGSYTTQDPPDYDNIAEGNNIVYFRSWDNAGNISSTYVTTVLKLNTTAPTSPQNVTATPSTNTTNNFAFSWAAPSSFTGNAGDLTYCYTINTLPTDGTCIYTEPGVTSLAAGAFATQPGANTFYVVAKDTNVNYATAASTTFTANTSAPGIPVSPEIADVSTKVTSSWKLALSWGEPSDVGAGVASYRIYRSTDNNSFTQIATTAGTSHVDTGLDQEEYYYKIRACDSANNCGAYSSAVSETPTGRFTSPPDLVSQPVVTVSTRNATISWVTDRESDSRIQYGLSSGNYFATEAASSEQTKTHSIELSNLDAGTTYHYRARWTDSDGNIGSSSELTFATLPAPVIKDVTVRRTTTSTATIQLTSKDATQIKFYYGKTDAFGGLQVINTSRSESTYTIELTGLDDGAKYYYGVNPVDSEGNEYKIARIDSFTTPARPRITNVRMQPVAEEPTSTQEITWDTNVPTTSLLRLTPKGGSTREIVDSALVTSHKLVARGLLDDTEYSIVAESRDKDGTIALSDPQVLKTALDTRPPKVSNVTVEATVRGVGAEARGQVVVSWKTDEPATSQVAYGEGTPGATLNNKTSEDTSLTFDHVVVVSDLSPSQVYTVQPISNDASKNSGTGSQETAIIGRASDDVITIVLTTIRKIFGF